MKDVYFEAGALWRTLSKDGHKLNYKRPNDYRRYNLYLIDGLVKIECNHGMTEWLTIDSTLYLWLNAGDTPTKSPKLNAELKTRL